MPAGAEGVPTVGVTVTVLVAVDDVPQPVAYTEIVAEPLKLAPHVTVPVAVPVVMELPLPVTDQV